MNKEQLAHLLGIERDDPTLAQDGVRSLLAHVNDSKERRKKLQSLLSSTAIPARVAALAWILNELLVQAEGAQTPQRKRLTERLRALSDHPRATLELELPAIAVAMLRAWPQLPDAALLQLESVLGEPEPIEDLTLTKAGGSAEIGGPAHSRPDNEEKMKDLELEIDVRGLPPELQTHEKQKWYLEETRKKLKTASGSSDPPDSALAYVAGKLLRTGQFQPTSSSFAGFVRQAWSDLTTEYRARSGMVSGLSVVQSILEILGGKSNGVQLLKKRWSVQQLVFIYDKALETLGTIAPSDSGFVTRVDGAYLDYAAGGTGFDGFELPTLDSSNEGDLLPANMISAGRLYGAYEYERLRLIPVVERITELWRAGVIPIANDSAGQLLNEYFWSREDRLTEAGRGMIYGRLFGATGTETSKDAQPNKQFEPLLRRFLTNVAQLKRLEEQQTVISNPGESRTLASENVRKTGREFATNLSLYGWGSAHFDASRIDAHLAMAFRIASDPQVQRAFAATTPSQVIERVSQQEFGVTPNIVKHETMARAGREIIELLARNPQALIDRTNEFQQVLGLENWDRLARNALAWLSVNGVTTEQLVSYSAPVDGIASPSLPALPGTPPAGQGINELRDMVSSGKMPSLDQLQRMFN